ncbi:hypothetical protein WMY93_003241 [Mugilogobius chulae]|uniref:U1-type domain-containing protein n=1 Tax=Mugilogobius chulae TaxID=88201 RepID=A0AAW0PXP4_9GOBI
MASVSPRKWPGFHQFLIISLVRFCTTLCSCLGLWTSTNQMPPGDSSLAFNFGYLGWTHKQARNILSKTTDNTDLWSAAGSGEQSVHHVIEVLQQCTIRRSDRSDLGDNLFLCERLCGAARSQTVPTRISAPPVRARSAPRAAAATGATLVHHKHTRTVSGHGARFYLHHHHRDLRTRTSNCVTRYEAPVQPVTSPLSGLSRTGLSAFSAQMDSCDSQNDAAAFHQDLQSPPGGALPSSSSSSAASYKPKRERKNRSYTLCEVCNIQLNSAAQAQIHYNGKSHQKRLKQIPTGISRQHR